MNTNKGAVWFRQKWRRQWLNGQWVI